MARAAVYRYLDAKNALFGLALGEALVLLSIAWPALLALPPLGAAMTVIGTYLAIRFVGRGRADGFLQHFAAWHLRRAITGGHLSAAARARAPRFPHAVYVYRDVPPRIAS